MRRVGNGVELLIVEVLPGGVLTFMVFFRFIGISQTKRACCVQTDLSGISCLARQLLCGSDGVCQGADGQHHHRHAEREVS